MYGKGKHDKSNYQPVSLLPILSNVSEKRLYKKVEIYIENILSNFQCGFRKGFNYTTLPYRQNRKSLMYKGEHFNALLTDQSKTFDCLPHT